MHTIYKILTFILIVFSSHLYAHPIISDLALRNITIGSDFKGTEILIFGALDIKGDVIILVHGPKRSLFINKKEKKYGFWVNGKREKLEDVEQFYSVSSTRKLSDVTTSDILNSIRINSLKLSSDKELNNAFKKMKIKDNLYTQSENNIHLINDKLFRSTIKFPGNISQGRYVIEILLFYDNSLFGMKIIPLIVSKVGIESLISNMNTAHPLLYAMFAVLGALFIGWFSSIIKRK